MPIYEYECNACSGAFEKRRKRKDPAPVVCPHCGSEDDSTRLMSVSSIQFKGSGFYTTDYVKGKLAVDARGRARDKMALENATPESPSESADASSGSDDSTSTSTETTPTESKPASAADSDD